MLDRRTMFICGAASAALPLLAAFSGGASAADKVETEIRALIDELGNELLAMLKLTGRAEREVRFRRLLLKGVDIDTVAGFVLGQHRRAATPEQLAEFRKLFEEFLVRTYVSRLGLFSGQTFAIRSVQKLGETEFLVQTLVEKPDSRPIRLDWRMRERDGRHQIIDVMVEGISMAVTQREEFTSVIRNGDGKVEALLDLLRQRIAAS